MDKTLKYVLVCFLALMALLLLIFMFFAIGHSSYFFSFGERESKLVLEEYYDIDSFDEIKINSVYSDIYVLNSNEKKVKVEIYSGNDKASSEIRNKSLVINKNDRKIACFGFCFQKEEVYVYLPTESEKNVIIETTSGEVRMEDFPKTSVSIKSTSGDIFMKNLTRASIESVSGDIEVGSVLDCKVKTVSGDIEIRSINKNVTLSTTSGDIEIENLFLKESGSLETVSGDVTVRNGNDFYVDAKSTSGSIRVKESKNSATLLKVKTISGDISVQ